MVLEGKMYLIQSELRALSTFQYMILSVGKFTQNGNIRLLLKLSTDTI